MWHWSLTTQAQMLCTPWHARLLATVSETSICPSSLALQTSSSLTCQEPHYPLHPLVPPLNLSNEESRPAVLEFHPPVSTRWGARFPLRALPLVRSQVCSVLSLLGSLLKCHIHYLRDFAPSRLFWPPVYSLSANLPIALVYRFVWTPTLTDVLFWPHVITASRPRMLASKLWTKNVKQVEGLRADHPCPSQKFS